MILKNFKNDITTITSMILKNFKNDITTITSMIYSKNTFDL